VVYNKVGTVRRFPANAAGELSAADMLLRVTHEVIALRDLLLADAAGERLHVAVDAKVRFQFGDICKSILADLAGELCFVTCTAANFGPAALRKQSSVAVSRLHSRHQKLLRRNFILHIGSITVHKIR